jgi:hypothetical protein
MKVIAFIIGNFIIDLTNPATWKKVDHLFFITVVGFLGNETKNHEPMQTANRAFDEI